MAASKSADDDQKPYQSFEKAKDRLVTLFQHAFQFPDFEGLREIALLLAEQPTPTRDENVDSGVSRTKIQGPNQFSGNPGTAARLDAAPTSEKNLNAGAKMDDSGICRSNDTVVATTLEECVDGNGWTCLHFAAAGNNAAIVAEIICRSPTSIMRRDTRKLTPLLVAARSGATDAFRLLLEAQQVEHGGTGIITSDDRIAALHFAVQAGSAAIVRLIMESSLTVTGTPSEIDDKTTRAPRSAATPLMEAIAAQDVEVVKTLLEFKTEVSMQQCAEYPPCLILAACSGNARMVEVLLMIPPHNQPSMSTAREAAQILKHLEVTDADGWTALHCAAEAGHLAVVRTLLTAYAFAGAALTLDSANVAHLQKKFIERENQGQTASSLASQNGHHDIVALLAELGSTNSQ